MRASCERSPESCGVARSIFFYTDSRVLGGAENAMFMLLGSIDRKVWEPTLLLEDAVGTEPLLERAAELGVAVRIVAPLPLGLGGARRVPAFARLLRADRPQVFHAHMSSPVACKWALAAAVLARVPAVLGTVQVGEYEPPDRSAYWQLRLLASRVGRYLAVSGAIAEELVEGLGWPAAKVEVVHNAVAVERFEVRESPSLHADLAGARPLILTPARLDAQKGHDSLLAAAAEIPEAVFVLAGDGPERGRLEALAERLGVSERVRFLGRRTDVPELLAACDIFALPSLYEGSSLAVLEAMAARRAIVSSAIPGTDELIEDGRDGLLVAPGDAPGLTTALRRLLADVQLREGLAAAARRRVEAEFSRERMAARVTAAYEELLGLPGDADATGGVEALPESARNPPLRRRDWRFALPAAELVERRRIPLPGGARRARRRAEAAGFVEVAVLWPGPLPWRLPQFWLPVESEAAAEHLLASRPSGSPLDAAARVAWRAAHRAGLLAPLYVVGRRADDPGPTAPPLLLTGGHRSINKIVGLTFEDGAEPSAASKFARVAEAEPGLAREAAALRRLAAELPGFQGAPRLRAEFVRAGRLAVTEEAVAGPTMLDDLDAASFGAYADRVTKVLVELVARSGHAGAGRRAAVIEPALAELERGFGTVLGAESVAEVRRRTEGLNELRPAFEHRDCSPWNIVVGPEGQTVLLDWESAEPDGLPGLDLFYFLANAGFVLDRAFERGTTRESYARLLDPATPNGAIVAAATTQYAAATGLDPADLPGLRLLCWTIHCASDRAHLELEHGPTPSPETLRSSVFLGLIEEELTRP
jgi:glycosyltransferase involved in cell wall biosynthesis